MILDEIVETKRREVAWRKERVPLRALETAAGRMPPARDFRVAVSAGTEPAVIAEVKRRSPSRGLLRPDFDPVRIAREYESFGASAISVLTDEVYFGGSDADLTAVKAAVRLPVLRKEFIIDPYQIYEARAIGADALLLIAAILTDGELRQFRELAASLGLAALVEIHDREELERALCTGAQMIGINNRNLKTFATDIRTSLEVAPLIPEGRIGISESGIRSRGEIETLSKAGIRAYLIGETLVAAADIGLKMRELLGK
ncbi:MAG: indole-3-glycerol phosphate synthase TrpC [Deltaproteobacteria bacterium]|nr:indole-3-glycerol phosphate synthase TrpC [Deltaproteobacteria bacterium]